MLTTSVDSQIADANEQERIRSIAALEKELRGVQDTRSGSLAMVELLMGGVDHEFWENREQQLKDDIDVLRSGSQAQIMEYYKRRYAEYKNPSLKPRPRAMQPRQMPVLTEEEKARNLQSFLRDLQGLKSGRPLRSRKRRTW